jgi:hypothetical protein
MRENQFDTIYHEHFSYLSLTAVERIFSKNGLTVFDVEEIPTHGGSLRVFAQKSSTGKHSTSERVSDLLKKEEAEGLTKRTYYTSFQPRVDKVKNDVLEFLIDAKKQNKKVAAYGAAAKGNTLLNYAGVKSDLISFVVDRNTAKQGKYLPGSRIEITNEDRLRSEKPDYILILPWNLKSEVREQLKYVQQWGAKFVTAIPRLEVF